MSSRKALLWIIDGIDTSWCCWGFNVFMDMCASKNEFCDDICQKNIHVSTKVCILRKEMQCCFHVGVEDRGEAKKSLYAPKALMRALVRRDGVV